MKIWHCLFIGLGFIACSEEEPLEDTGAIMEYKVDEDSLTLANGGTLERDLSNEPEYWVKQIEIKPSPFEG